MAKNYLSEPIFDLDGIFPWISRHMAENKGGSNPYHANSVNEFIDRLKQMESYDGPKQTPVMGVPLRGTDFILHTNGEAYSSLNSSFGADAGNPFKRIQGLNIERYPRMIPNPSDMPRNHDIVRDSFLFDHGDFIIAPNGTSAGVTPAGEMTFPLMEGPKHLTSNLTDSLTSLSRNSLNGYMVEQDVAQSVLEHFRQRRAPHPFIDVGTAYGLQYNPHPNAPAGASHYGFGVMMGRRGNGINANHPMHSVMYSKPVVRHPHDIIKPEDAVATLSPPSVGPHYTDEDNYVSWLGWLNHHGGVGSDFMVKKGTQANRDWSERNTRLPINY